MNDTDRTQTPAAAPTPGTWHVNAIKGNRIVGDEHAAEYDKLTINNANCTIATVYRACDARIIAAAPRLLAALEGMVERFSERDCQMISNGRLPHGESCTTCNAIRAIAFARTGEDA